MGADSSELAWQITASKQFLEDAITDPAYRCRTLAYPFYAHDQREMNALMDVGYLGARNGERGPYPLRSPVTFSSLNNTSVYQAPIGPQKIYPWWNDSSEAYCRMIIRQWISTWKRDGVWTNWYGYSQADWDSAHADWALDELVSDGGVWVAPFSEVVEYVREYHVTVENPVDRWSDSGSASASLHGLPFGQTVYVVVVAYDTLGVESGWSNEARLVLDGTTPVDIREEASVSGHAYWMAANRPNPMAPGTSVPFFLAKTGKIKIDIHDVVGRLVSVLTEGDFAAGPHEVPWDGTDMRGGRAPSGVYFCRIETPWGAQTSKVVLVR
jgi:hypothetical protein